MKSSKRRLEGFICLSREKIYVQSNLDVEIRARTQRWPNQGVEQNISFDIIRSFYSFVDCFLGKKKNVGFYVDSKCVITRNDSDYNFLRSRTKSPRALPCRPIRNVDMRLQENIAKTKRNMYTRVFCIRVYSLQVIHIDKRTSNARAYAA